MSWLFSQALVEAYSEDICSAGEQSVPLSGNPTQLAYLLPDRMMAFSRLSQFGMTFKPLTADRGEALLMSYLEAFPVKTSQQQEKEPESKESDLECGEKWLGWSAKFDPHTSTLRTAQCSLLEEEPELLQTLPRSGMTRSGMLWERQTLVLRTSETESGLWPTPCLPGNGGTNGKAKLKEMLKWPTPTVCGNYNRKGLSKTSGDGLATAVSKWPTPTAHNAKETGAPSEYRRNTPTLTARVNWSTPVANETSHRKSKYAQGGIALSTQAGGKLNPTWVEWLMGWPLGWTDLRPLEMDKFQQWQQQHLDC
jgi:hypothetical protein